MRDLTQLDFSLWGYLKSSEYVNKRTTTRALQEEIKRNSAILILGHPLYIFLNFYNKWKYHVILFDILATCQKCDGIHMRCREKYLNEVKKIRMSDISQFEDQPERHIAFLHFNFKDLIEDEYMIDLAISLKEAGYIVTIYSAEYDFIYHELNPTDLRFKCMDNLLKWIPESWYFFKSLFMAWNLYWNPPKPAPQLYVVDVHPIALSILSLLSGIKTVYLAHFSSLRSTENYSRDMTIKIDFIAKMSLLSAESIIVQSGCLANILGTSYPIIGDNIRVIYPALNNGRLNNNPIDVYNILPNLSKPHFYMFLCFGSYKKMSNFYLVIKAFEELLKRTEKIYTDNLQLVIAGNLDANDIKQRIYFEKLVKSVIKKSYYSQVSFLKSVSKIQQKTLIINAVAVLFPAENDPFPHNILTCLYLGARIIATNSGFASEALVNRFSGLLIDPSVRFFALAMLKVLTDMVWAKFLSDMALNEFKRNFTKFIFDENILEIVDQCIEDEVTKLKCK